METILTQLPSESSLRAQPTGAQQHETFGRVVRLWMTWYNRYLQLLQICAIRGGAQRVRYTLMSDIASLIKVYEQQEQELLKIHSGKAVLFAEGKLQGVFDDPGGATHAAMKRFKVGEFLVRVVGDNSLPAKFYLRVA